MKEFNEVSEFIDYREFLKSYVHYKKKNNPAWSLAIWKKRLNFRSTAILSMVLSGKRHTGQKFIASLANYFQFNDFEIKYFSELVKSEKRTKSIPNLIILRPFIKFQKHNNTH